MYSTFAAVHFAACGPNAKRYHVRDAAALKGVSGHETSTPAIDFFPTDDIPIATTFRRQPLS
jgi:hypothetical protein